MTTLKLAFRLLMRDARAGELTLLALALLVAVGCSTAISLFADRMQRTMTLQAGEFLAGDLVLTSSSPVAESWLGEAGNLGLRQAQTTDFSSVLLENQEMLLAAVKAVSDQYPLRGVLKTADSDSGQDDVSTSGPSIGEVWVEPRILPALNLAIGDWLTVGEKPLRIAKILRYEPDKAGDFYSFSPRVMMNRADLAATGVIQPGSHVHYYYQFAGEAGRLSQFKNWLQPQLQPSQRILDIHEDRPQLGSALDRAERYLGLAGVAVVVIAGVAIAMAAARYSERHFNGVALLRCLGADQSTIFRLYVVQFCVLGVIASGLGCAIGWIGQQGLLHFLRPLLPKQLAEPGISGVGYGFAIGMAVLLGFASPPLLRLREVSPLRVFRRDLAPLPVRAWLVYGTALALVAGLVWRYTGDTQLIVAVLGGGAVALLVLALVVAMLLRALRLLAPRLSLAGRFGLLGVVRKGRGSIGQILAFSITLAAMSLSFSVRNDVLEQWRQQLPEKAPNHFVLNIIPEQRDALQAELNASGIDASQMYPVIRGRLVAINGEAVQKRVSKDSRGEAATHRELSLTWTERLPDDNTLVRGQAWPVEAEPGWVSVEEKLAQSLAIRVGDELRFTVGSEQVHARVANIRSLRWDTMKPNFYMIFSPGSLDGFPSTYLTSFYLSPEAKAVLHTIVKRFPSLTILEVDQIVAQIADILRQLSKAIDLVLYFALLAGFTVLFAAVYGTLDVRMHEAALMRALGARRGWLHLAHAIEFGIIGWIAGLLAVMLAQAVLYALYAGVMHLPFKVDVMPFILLPVGAAGMVTIAAYWGLRQVVRQSPLLVLRRF